MGLLRDAALAQSVDLTCEHLGLFGTYLDELVDWNRRINLTGLRDRERIVVDLFLDSLVPVPYLPTGGRLLDVGSGAGLPGLPIKISSPDLEVDLLEPYSKKVSFLNQMIRLLRLDGVAVIRGRIEQEKNLLDPAGYHVITARALADPAQIVVWCAPHLRVGGRLVGFLGHKGEEKLLKYRSIILENGLELIQTINYLLPGKDSERTTVIWEKRAK